MTSQAKLTVRPKPHLDYVMGYPGIVASSQASRSAAHIAGSIEVRLGSKGLKASWLRVELRKLESAPGGENWGELIGKGPIDIWTARTGSGSGDRETDVNGQWEILKTADFPFKILIPEGLPPSCRLDKQCGISYEVVASLCVKSAKGMFRKEETTSVIQSMHPIVIEKHELHSTWPIYNQSDLHAGENGLLRAKLHRTGSCFAPGDRVKVKIIVYSNRVEPAKLKSVAFSIKETVTFHGLKSGRTAVTSTAAANKAASQTVETVTQKAKQVGKKLYKGDSLNFDLECVIPKTHSLMTISTAKHIEVSYTMRVYVDINKAPIVIDHIPMLMTTFPRAESVTLIRKIGFVEGLSERDLVIEDDDDDNTFGQVMSRKPTQRPPASRTVSYGSVASQQYGRGVQRRDTIMTNFSGPGMAGRGVPGQVFDYAPYANGSEQYYNGGMVPPRPAFAGPPSIYEGEEGALSPTERAALTHYAGVDYSTFASASGLDSPPAGTVPRPAFMSIPEDIGMRRDLNRQSTQSPASPAQRGQLRQAEEEKERLFQRAREQAERNQRRIDARPQSQQIPYTAPFSPSLNGGSRSGTPIVRPVSAFPATSAAEEEKQRLYERARVEAETYQRGYEHGATFPKEEGGSTSRTAPPAAEKKTEIRRNSDLFWLDRPGPADAQGSRNVSGPASAPPVQPPTLPTYATAEEEKKRLYEQAKAQTETHLKSQQGQGSSSAGGSSQPSSQVPDSALSEKAQLAKFQAARDAVERHQMQGSSSQTQDRQRPQSMAPFSSPTAPAAAPSSPAPGLSEKEQMKLYYAAKDRQAEAEQTTVAPSSSSNPVRHSMGSTVASPRPTYATNFQNGNNAGWQQSTSSPAPPPSAPGFTAGPSNGHSASPSLPPLHTLGLGNNVGSGQGTTSSWLPKIASSTWLDDDDFNAGPSTSAPPPPIPPKTPMISSPRP